MIIFAFWGLVVTFVLIPHSRLWPAKTDGRRTIANLYFRTSFIHGKDQALNSDSKQEKQREETEMIHLTESDEPRSVDDNCFGLPPQLKGKYMIHKVLCYFGEVLSRV